MKQLTKEELKRERHAIIVTLLVMVPLILVSAVATLYWLYHHFLNMQ